MFHKLKILIIILVFGVNLTACATTQQQTNIDEPVETVGDNDIDDNLTKTQHQTNTTESSEAVDDKLTKIQQQNIFDELWEAVNDNYVYEDFNGINWEEVRTTYQKHIDVGLSTDEFYEAMSEMVALLGDEHSMFFTPATTREIDGSYVGIGVYLHPLPEKDYAVTILSIPDSPADKAGIAAHDRLLAVDGMPFCCNEQGQARIDLVLGPEGTSVTLTVQTPGEEPRQLTIIRSTIQPDIPVFSQQLDGSIGYILVPPLESDIAEKTEEALRKLSATEPLDGLILDLRTCQGGFVREMIDILKLFTTGNQGSFISRERNQPLIYRGVDIAGSQDIPLVVLTGDITAYACELMAGIIQDSGRAILVGSKTAGIIEVAYRYNFSDGSSAMIAQETFLPSSGTNWENVGVQPNVKINLGWDDFATESEDLVLNSALELLTQYHARLIMILKNKICV